MTTISLKVKKLNRFTLNSKESEYREDESSRGVLRLAKALIRHTSYSDGNHFDEVDQLYELADEYLSDFYDRNGIEELYEIDDAEY